MLNVHINKSILIFINRLSCSNFRWTWFGFSIGLFKCRFDFVLSQTCWNWISSVQTNFCHVTPRQLTSQNTVKFSHNLHSTYFLNIYSTSYFPTCRHTIERDPYGNFQTSKFWNSIVFCKILDGQILSTCPDVNSARV